MLLANLHRGIQTSNSLFINSNGDGFTADQIRITLNQELSGMLGKPLQMSEYRQFTVLFSEVHLGESLDLNNADDENERIFDAQTGHSTKVAQLNYGRNTLELPNTTRLKKVKFYVASIKWQKLLQLESAARTVTEAITAPMSNMLLTQGVNITPPYIQEPIEVQNYAQNVDKSFTEITLLAALRKTTGDINACWRSKLQKQFVVELLSPESSILITETGFGKSLLVMMLANISQSGATLYTATLKSVVDDFVQRMERSNIAFERLEQLRLNSSPNSQIVVCYSEYFVSDEGRSAIANFFNSRTLKRVVIYEAHELITGAQYRLSLAQIRKLPTINVSQLSYYLLPCQASLLIR